VREISFTQALRETLTAEMQRNKKIILIGEDIGRYGGAFGATRGLLDLFGPARVINTPISELSFTGMAVGAAVSGMRPIVEIMFMDFITLAIDPIVNMAAKLKYILGEKTHCPLVIRTACGAGRCYGPTHSQNFEAWFAHVPGINIVAPSSPSDAAGLLKTATQSNSPTIFLEHKLLYGIRERVSFAEGKQSPIPFGKAKLIKEGKDITLIAWSWMVQESLAAAALLKEKNIDVEVLDLRTIVPLDIQTILKSVKKTGKVCVVEESPQTCGFSAEIISQIVENGLQFLNFPAKRINALNSPVPATPYLEEQWMPNRHSIAKTVISILQNTKKNK